MELSEARITPDDREWLHAQTPGLVPEEGMEEPPAGENSHVFSGLWHGFNLSYFPGRALMLTAHTGHTMYEGDPGGEDISVRDGFLRAIHSMVSRATLVHLEPGPATISVVSLGKMRSLPPIVGVTTPWSPALRPLVPRFTGAQLEGPFRGHLAPSTPWLTAPVPRFHTWLAGYPGEALDGDMVLGREGFGATPWFPGRRDDCATCVATESILSEDWRTVFPMPNVAIL